MYRPRASAPVVALLLWFLGAAGGAQPRPSLADRVATLSRTSVWTLERSIPMAFTTHHPQGLVKIGDRLFISSVEIKVPTRRGSNRADGFDRDTGEGVGHLFEATMTGNLVADRVVGEGTMYHPGGIDFDGTHIWISVAEYRPNSRSIVYRVDPATRTPTEVFRFADHLGAIVRDPDANVLHAVSWGSRWFYRFALDSRGRATNAAEPPATLRTANPSHYVDYQDCKYAGRRRMVCTGIADVPRGGMRTAADAGRDRSRRSRRRPAGAPGAGRAADARRREPDAQSRLLRDYRFRTAGLFPARGRHVHALRLRHRAGALMAP